MSSMTKDDLTLIIKEGKKINTVKKMLKNRGYHNTRFYKPTKGTNLQDIARACMIEANEMDFGDYWLFGSTGVFKGFEWVWLEETKKEPVHYNVSIWTKEIT